MNGAQYVSAQTVISMNSPRKMWTADLCRQYFRNSQLSPKISQMCQLCTDGKGSRRQKLGTYFFPLLFSCACYCCLENPFFLPFECECLDINLNHKTQTMLEAKAFNWNGIFFPSFIFRRMNKWHQKLKPPEITLWTLFRSQNNRAIENHLMR